MDWSKVKVVPKYNPYQFELARNVRGSAKYEIAKEARMTTKRISEIETGLSSPTEDEVKVLMDVLEFPIGFFEQFYETTLDISGPLVKTIPIDYYKYKVFRDLNPPPLSIVK